MAGKKEGKNYWKELVEEQTKVSLGTKDRKFYSGYVKSFDDKGIFFIDKFNNGIFISFDNLNFVEPYREENGK